MDSRCVDSPVVQSSGCPGWLARAGSAAKTATTRRTVRMRTSFSRHAGSKCSRASRIVAGIVSKLVAFLPHRARSSPGPDHAPSGGGPKMKEDVLEQIVDDYLQFQGYFT